MRCARGAVYDVGVDLRPESPTFMQWVGVELTEGFMMEPEASVSALVFHHPDARYFSA